MTRPTTSINPRVRGSRRRIRRTLGAATTLAVVATSLLVGSPAASAQVDPSTVAPSTAPAPEPAPAPPGPPVLFFLPLTGGNLGRGATGPEVFLMQITLVSRGFWLSDFPGAFGESTRHALVAFQKYFGLGRTGVLDPLTRFVLGARIDRVVPARPRPGRAIEVDLGRQIANISENGQTIWVFDISSGARRTPTPRGTFRIQRQINAMRTSRLGKLWRPKYFTGGYALHGSPSVPAHPASHGCVRLTNQEINFIWDSGLAPIGTPVTVF
ncbi:MAG: L,D-transpeptidase family protein [Microthrixaceae bacterium]